MEMVKHAILYPVLAFAQEAQAVANGLGERQRVRFGVHGIHRSFGAGVADPPPVVGGRHPQVGRPHLHAELFGEEDRADRLAASQVEHPHARPKLKQLAERLGEPGGNSGGLSFWATTRAYAFSSKRRFTF